MDEELGPCPFCGGKAFLDAFLFNRTNGYQYQYKIECSECNASTDTFYEEDQCRLAWNKRYTKEKVNG